MQPHAVITPAYRLVFRLEIANRPRSAEYILPSMFDKDVVPTIAKAVSAATRAAGLSRRSSLTEA